MLLGQHKYVKITYSQIDASYKNHSFSRLQELRINRVVRRYDDVSKHNCTEHDLFLEHGNKFLSNFKIPKTLAGFEKQSIFVGMGIMCRQFVDTWYASKWKAEEEASYRKHIVPRMTLEKLYV